VNKFRINLCAFVPLCLCVLAFVSLTGCSKPITADATPVEKLTPVEVVTVRASEHTAQLTLMSALLPESQVTVVAKANGTLTKLLVNLGDRVVKDQLIAQIDDELYQSLYKQAESQLDFASASFQRLKKLHEKQLASAQEFEAVKSQKASAEAVFTVARLNLENTLIKAPIRGIVSAKLVEANNQVGMGTPVVALVDISSLKINAGVSEIEVGQLALNHRVRLTVDAYPNDVFFGKINAIGVQSSPLDNMYPVEIAVINNDGLRLKPGMTATIVIDKQHFANAVIIAQSVVLEREDGKYVMLASEGKALLRKVEPGEVFGKSVQILSGLSVGEKLIINGQQNVVDGEEVNIVNNPS